MCQGPLCPNLSQKVQKEVSQMGNHKLSSAMLQGGLSVNLNHLKTNFETGNGFYNFFNVNVSHIIHVKGNR